MTKFNNSHQQLLGERTARQGVRKIEDGIVVLGSMEGKGRVMLGRKMDATALDHLQFLNKL